MIKAMVERFFRNKIFTVSTYQATDYSLQWETENLYNRDGLSNTTKTKWSNNIMGQTDTYLLIWHAEAYHLNNCSILAKNV